MTGTLVEPAFCTHPPYSRTLGPEVADLASLAGLEPDAEQRLGLDLLFALDERGFSAAFEMAVICSRQNLKTALFEMAALGWLYLTDQRLVVWSAHEFLTSQEAHRDLAERIEGTAVLSRRLKAIHRGNGEEAIELIGGRRLIFKARTKGGGRGLSGDKVVLDEAFALQPQHMGALLPTLSARPDPQVVYGSSAGLADSAVLRGVRDRGRVGTGRLAYLEWCDDLPGGCELGPACSHALTAPGCRLDDEARWARANPAMGRRISAEYVRGERQAMPPEEFARERLGWWDDPAGTSVLSVDAWLACADPASVSTGAPVYGVDASPGLRSAAILSVTKRPDGLPHIEVVEHRPGASWLPGWAAELQSRHSGITWAVDPSGPAGALLPDLRAQGLDVSEMSTRDLGQACVDFAAKVRDEAVRHTGDPALTAAVEGAGQRDIGDGLWAWSRRRSDVDICPLVAATAAHWAWASRFQGVFFGAWR